MGFCSQFWNVVLGYDTVKFVTVKNKKVGLVYRVVQLTIIAYLIGYVLVVKKGYQQFSDVESATTTKVKGVLYTNNSDDEFDPSVENTSLYRRFWDITDTVIPPSENDAFFIATNVIITPDQELSTCAESPSVAEALCDPHNNTCEKGTPFLLGNGVATGDCIPFDIENKTYTCEINGWCPLEVDTGPLKNTTNHGILNNTGLFTVLIKNFINFPLYNVSRRNILNTQKKDYLTKCHYSPDKSPLCPVFVLKDVVEYAGHDYNQMSKSGGVMGIIINWDCDLDFNVEDCIPTYSFKRLDNPDAQLAPGWNFRYANFFSDKSRTLYKLSGIDFVVIITGRGGRFHIVPLLLNVGSGLALMTMASVICDLCILYIVKKRELYKSKKYYEVQTEYDEFRNLSESTVQRRTGNVSSNQSGYSQQLDDD